MRHFVAGQEKLAGIFRYLTETYGEDAPYDVQIFRTKAEFSPGALPRVRRDAARQRADFCLWFLREEDVGEATGCFARDEQN